MAYPFSAPLVDRGVRFVGLWRAISVFMGRKPAETGHSTRSPDDATQSAAAVKPVALAVGARPIELSRSWLCDTDGEPHKSYIT